MHQFFHAKDVIVEYTFKIALKYAGSFIIAGECIMQHRDWRTRGNIIRTVLCCIVDHNCVQSSAYI